MNLGLDISLVVAFDKNFAIGKNGTMPWYIPEDLAFFKSLTVGHVVIMGRVTWESIGCKGLSDRVNIVLSSNMINNDNVIVMKNMSDVLTLLQEEYRDQKIFVIGGAKLYESFMPLAKRIYTTHVDLCVADADVHFPHHSGFEMFKISMYSPLRTSSNNSIKYRFVEYDSRNLSKHQEYRYFDLINLVLENGESRPDRTGVGTMSIFGPQLSFDIEHELPLLTTKFVGWKSILKELLFFLHGKTDTKLLEKEGVNIWKANTTREFLDARGLVEYDIGDIGPMYGWIWRHVGAEYKGCNESYVNQGVDQLQALVQGLREDPFSRRHLITTFCPLYTDQGVLAPCHGICVQMYVSTKKSDANQNYLSCHVYLRSNDIFLGQPYNIASYAMFTNIIAMMVGMTPKNLIMSVGDCHLYKFHIMQSKLQLDRKPLPFPVFKVSDTVKTKTFDDLVLDDFEVIGYMSHPAIKAPMAV